MNLNIFYQIMSFILLLGMIDNKDSRCKACYAAGLITALVAVATINIL